MSELLLDLYKKMYLIRVAEAEIIREYHHDEMRTPMHMSLGEEAICAGVCRALPPGSHGYGTYRSHGLYLAWTGETDKFFAELYGKATGTAGGKAGSMHLTSPEHGLMATSAVVGTTIPLAVGDALESKYSNANRIAAVFFGDGATDEGVFWESLNMACLFKLPVLFVCEDNGLAIHIPKERRRGYVSLPRIIQNFKCNVFDSDGWDVEKVYSLATQAIDLILNEGVPSVLNLRYYRYLEHVGINQDLEANYRPEGEYLEWQNKDTVKSLLKKLIEKGLKKEVVAMEREIRSQVKLSRIKAQKDSFPSSDNIMKGVYCE